MHFEKIGFSSRRGEEKFKVFGGAGHSPCGVSWVCVFLDIHSMQSKRLLSLTLRHDEVQNAPDDDGEDHEAEPDDDALFRHRPVLSVIEELTNCVE